MEELRYCISVDLDLFSNVSFENEIIQEALIDFYQRNFIVEGRPPRFGIFAYIKDIKTDIVYHPHPLIQPAEEIEGVRMFSTADIMANENTSNPWKREKERLLGYS